LSIARDGARRTVQATVRERPRQQGARFTTHYDHVTVNGTRHRLMVTQPMRDGRPVPGRHPTLFLIGGIGAYSLDGPFEGIEYGDILAAAVERGWATVRVDKAGQGDSEGGPTIEAGFDAELASYRAALAALPRHAFVDTARVVLFGHSMGGVYGPLLAAEQAAGRAPGVPRLRALAVYGTIGKPWMEYLVEAVRRQATLAGAPLPAVEAMVRDQATLSHYLVLEGLDADAVRQRRPDLAGALVQHYPDGRTFSGLAFPFWRQLAARRLAEAWAAVDAPVLAMHGESDFVGARADPELIAAIVNQAHPGRATFVTIPASDHNFRRYPTMQASLQGHGQPPAPLNPAARERLLAWLDTLVTTAAR
jgi:pimeloyl-ACP methyl ester carboxylesterase